MAERRLGRGLGSLLSNSPARETIRKAQEGSVVGAVVEIPVADIHPNRYQPRQTFDLETISELATSMESSGLITPIVVSPDGEGRYELIAGERRWRAASHLGWETIRAEVRETTEQQKLELALIENVQREDLNPIDRALAYRQLIDTFQLTHEKVSRRIGKSRSTLTNLLRLLDLPEDLQDMVRDGNLSAGHARALLGVQGHEEQRELAEQVGMDDLSVRALEGLVQREKERHDEDDAGAPSRPRKSPQVREMEENLGRHLGTKVRILPKGAGGRITIEYYSTEDFERIFEQLR